jgi:hypothetical protein
LVHFFNYSIKFSPAIRSIGDIDENKKQILIHENMPRKFKEGIAVHEIEERNWLKKGHSYNFSHEKAQKKELDFYAKKFGSKNKAKSFLNDEEEHVNKLFKKML